MAPEPGNLEMTVGDISADGAVPGMVTKEGGLGSRSQSAALATLCVVLFLTFLDNTVVSVGLADVQSGLHAGLASLQWVVNGYALTFAAFMLAGGTLGDMLGRKMIMLGGVAFFCAGSVVAATATNVDFLMVGRVVMGIGAAASEPGTLSIIRHVYPDQRTRADALGVWAAVSGLALALGPVIGGVLVGLWSWRAIFWFNLLIGAVAFTMALRFVPETSNRTGKRIDWVGIVLGALTLATVSFGIIQGEQPGYLTWWIDLFFASSVVLGLAFIFTEHRVKMPILDFSLFRRSPFSGSVFVAFVAYFGMFAVLGSIVNSKLTGQLASRLKAIGIPLSYQHQVIQAVTGGGSISGGAAGQAEHSKNAAIAKIATKVVNAAYDAFGSGLHLALEISGVLLVLGALVAVTMVHVRQGERTDLL
jgi:multidrug resistance protein